jgi:hypothetical protein
MRYAASALFLAATCMLAAPAAHAFTVENKDAGGQYGAPKFDLEEQAKAFRKEGSPSNGIATGSTLYETPLGNGKLQFGVSQGGGYGFGSPFSSQFGPSRQNSREEFDRRLAPPSSLDFNNPR